MAQPFRVRAVNLYVQGGQKIAELLECTVSIKGQGERHSTAAGTIKTTGQPVGDVDFSTLMPVSGMSVDAVGLTIAQTQTYIVAPFNGRNYQIDGTFDEATMKSVQSSGKTTGDFKFSGGAKEV